MIDPAIFENLQTKIDEETVVRDELHEIVQSLARKGRTTQAILSRAHSTPSKDLKSVLDDAATQILAQKEDVSRLAEIANKHPFYKYNGVWSRELQNLVYYIELCAWLGGLIEYKNSSSKSSFLTIEEVGNFLDVPVNLKDEDKFHLTIEEYLLALISMVEELSRLAVNSVTLGDYHRPLEINNFIKDLFAGFQLLNLKNDILRKRSDGIKYSVKKVEDVVYDLSLRNLIPKA
ncbi:recombination hotspot-binding protein (Translin), putative [Talaromyces stipitatus ATCC 10500]|uniref:Recombination hotspot-binding protein (Translin), putative n=1 Tax=Talaromyces stipitatus (strain ATCC 10500 / CBS 375.48 / QM 6759 / NRRL 1006) TaxID=441959 RepID=B8MPG5_TALSN|nr:recombination hotspot-binding protein (Translin), putative [Talaromyces stipitatus ATCC 10500]EED14404.1 recombination hotspot-binding protein (Translin), putative [Talaromyces stipitatus ATCC 10500]